MSFITENDYDVQAREEILTLLDPSGSATNIAERMAIDQIRQYLSGRYDCNVIFAATGDDRSYFIVMITIDIALYHLWSKRAPKKIPEHRAQRYQDALDWLKDVGTGKITTDLPPLTDNSNTDDENGNEMQDVIIKSRYKQQNYKY